MNLYVSYIGVTINANKRRTEKESGYCRYI